MTVNVARQKFLKLALFLCVYAIGACDDSSENVVSDSESIYDIWFKSDALVDEDGMDLREKGVAKVTLCLESKITTVDYVIAKATVDENKQKLRLDYYDLESEIDYPVLRYEYEFSVDANILTLSNSRRSELDSEGNIVVGSESNSNNEIYERKKSREDCALKD